LRAGAVFHGKCGSGKRYLARRRFDRISFERYDTKVCIGRSLDEAVEFAMALGPAGEIIRLAAEEGQKRKPQVIDALQKLFRTHLRDDGVWLDSSSWFVSAWNPPS
jgi:hypothetical protein